MQKSYKSPKQIVSFFFKSSHTASQLCRSLLNLEQCPNSDLEHTVTNTCMVDVPYMFTFSNQPAYPSTRNTSISTRWLANPNQSHQPFPLNTLRAHMNVLFISKAKILVLIKWSYKSPPIKLSHVVQYLFNKCLFGVHSWIRTLPHTT